MNNMNVTIDGTFASINYNRNGNLYSKTMTLDDFVSILASRQESRTPLLPPGCRLYEKHQKCEILYLEIPPVQRSIVYQNREKKKIFEGIVPFPWALLKLIVQKRDNGVFEPVGGSIYAMKHPLMSENDQLYHFPSANVYGDHHICWGSTFSSKDSSFKKLSETGRAVDYFFGSTFNTDIHPRINKYGRYEDMLRALEGKTQFDNEILAASLSFATALSERNNY